MFRYTLIGHASREIVSRREARAILRSSRDFIVQRRRGRTVVHRLCIVRRGQGFDRLLIELQPSVDRLLIEAMVDVESLPEPPAHVDEIVDDSDGRPDYRRLIVACLL